MKLDSHARQLYPALSSLKDLEVKQECLSKLQIAKGGSLNPQTPRFKAGDWILRSNLKDIQWLKSLAIDQCARHLKLNLLKVAILVFYENSY